MKNELKLVSRPNPSQPPALPLPIHVRSAGHYRLGADWEEHFEEGAKEFAQIYWCVSGEGLARVGGVEHALRGGDVLYYLPFEERWQKSLSPCWEYRWFTFDGPMAGDFMRAYGYPRGPLRAGSCPNELFNEIDMGLLEMGVFSQRRLVGVAAEILALAGRRVDDDGRASRLTESFVAAARDNYFNSTVNVNTIADQMGVHRSTLCRLFKNEMGVSPKDYLFNLKMCRALALLRETDLPVGEVAELSGFSSAGYFCRAMVRAEGMGPKDFRRRFMELA